MTDTVTPLKILNALLDSAFAQMELAWARSKAEPGNERLRARYIRTLRRAQRIKNTLEAYENPN